MARHRHPKRFQQTASAFLIDLLSLTTTFMLLVISLTPPYAFAQFSRTTLLSDTDLTVSGRSQPPPILSNNINEGLFRRTLISDQQQRQLGSSADTAGQRLPATGGGHTAETGAVSAENKDKDKDKCVAIEIPMCIDLVEYNMTKMPNFLNHGEQKEAGYEAHSWLPLIKLNCSNYLRMFLCAVYVPMCTPVIEHTLPPCRSLCEAARDDCLLIMQRFGNLPWPSTMQCNKFPTRAENELCFGPEIDMHRPKNNLFNQQFSFNKPEDGVYSTTSPSKQPILGLPSSPSGGLNDFYSPDASGALEYQFVCPLSLQRSGHSVWIDDDNNRSVVENCGFPCGRPDLAYYYAAQQPPVVTTPTVGGVAATAQFQHQLGWSETRNIIGITAIVCCAGCVLTILTFLFDTNRFHYPERPMLYVVGCYAFISGVYVFSYLQADNNDVVCESSINSRVVSVATAAATENVTFSRLPTVVQGTEKSACVFSFIIYYFTWLASLLWWLMLSITWFLSAALKWGTESIHEKTAFFHIIAWGVPALTLSVVLAMSRIEGDPVAGFCMVGGVLSPSMQMVFVIIPLVIALTVGVVLLFCGFIAISRVRTMIKTTQTPSGAPPTEFTRQSLAIMEKLMWRIGLFACTFVGANGLHAAMLIYEQIHRRRFMLAWRARTCQILGVPCPSLQHYAAANGFSTTEPGLWLPTVRHLAVLAVGVASAALLLLTFKTCRVWWCKCVCCCRRRSKKGGDTTDTSRRSAVGSNVSSSLMQQQHAANAANARNGFSSSQHHQFQRHHGGGANLALLNSSGGHVSAMATPQLAAAAFHQHNNNGNYAGSHLLSSHSDHNSNGNVAIGLRVRGGYGSEHMEPTQV